MSSMDFTINPACCKAVMALSRPLPGPLTMTSTSRMPNFIAFSAACWAAICPANGVLFRLPLKLQVPPVDQQRVSPLVSVIVTMVLLKDALMYAIPDATLRLILRFFVAVVFAILQCHIIMITPEYRLNCYRKSLTPFFPATVFLGPFRVRALVRVRCPRTGKPFRCRMPR